MKKRLIAFALVFALLLTLAAGCVPQNPKPAEPAAQEESPTPSNPPVEEAPAAQFAPGTYQSIQSGHNGDLTVEATFTENEITAVAMKDHAESERIGDAAITAIQGEVVSRQTLDVDMVSGSTITYHAIMRGLKDCIVQAVGEESDLVGERTPKQEDAVIQTDIAVIGGGAAGLSAAAQAANACVKVVVVEKLASVGGSTGHSSGAVLTTTDEGKPFTADDFYNLVMFKSADRADAKLVRKVADVASQNIEWLRSLGVVLNAAQANYLEWDVLTVSPDAKGALVRPNGMKIINSLEQEAIKTGNVDIELNTRAISILREDGRIKGVEAERQDGSRLTVLAPAVIIATGGYDNGELMKEHDANALAMRHVSAVGNIGDGIMMAEALGAGVVFNEGRAAVGNAMGMNKYGLPANYVEINGAGRRITDESAHYMVEFNAFMDSESSDFYRLYDSNNELEALEKHVASGLVVKADTIEALSEKIGVDSAILGKTAERYNELKGKKDEDFGKDASMMLGLEQAPFYAIKVVPEILLSIGGIHINEAAEVLDNNGEPIPMLYAAGETANGTFFYNEYAYSGAAIQFAVATGRIAADNAVAKLKP